MKKAKVPRPVAQIPWRTNRMLLVKGKNETVVEYSLAGYQNPIGVAEWKNRIEKSLPAELRSSLPSIEEIEKEME